MPAKLPSRLVKSRHGVYYLRVTIDGREQRKSLRTRDPVAAQRAAYAFGATMPHMTIKNPFDFDPEMLAIAERVTIELRAKQLAQEKRIEDAARKLAGLDATPAADQPAPATQTTVASMTVAEACDKYLDYRAGEIVGGTVRSWRSHLNRLKRELGWVAVGDVTTDTLNKIKDALDSEELAPKTIKNYFDTFDLLFAWLAEDRREIVFNPVRKPKWSRTAKARLNAERGRPRHPFTGADLKTLFDRERLATLSRPDDLWIPILALYTGARLESLCRLTTSDFTEYAPGRWQVHFDPQWDKTGRNRNIPLHPSLIDAGLLEYVAEVKRLAIEGDYLFPLLTIVEGRRGHYPSRSFGEHRKKLGIGTGVGKDMHSFRTTLISSLEFNRAHPGAKRAFAGHEDGDRDDVHARNYEKATYTVHDLATEILPRIDYASWPGHAPELKGIYNPNMLTRFIESATARKPRAVSRKPRKKVNT